MQKNGKFLFEKGKNSDILNHINCSELRMNEGGRRYAGTREYEDLNKNLEMVDGHAVKAPEDYQDPEELYQALIARVRKYHPSADITMIEKAIR